MFFFYTHRELNKGSKVKIVHTSVHGVGHDFVQAAFKAFDLPAPYAVEEQKEPDPEFPTVVYPNPEEGAGVLVHTDEHERKNLLHKQCLLFVVT